MNFNDSIPPWLAQGGSPVQSLLAGAQVGSQIANNFANLRRLRLAQNEQDAMMPLKKEQYENALASSALDIAAKRVEQQNELETQAGVVALYTTMQGIKNWASPEAMGSVDAVVAKYPALALTKGGTLALGKAQAMHQIATAADTRLQTAETAAQSRIDINNADNAARRVDLENKLKTAKDIADDKNKTILEKEDRANKAEMDQLKTKWSMQPPGFDVMSRAQLALWHAQVKKLADADPTMSAKDFEVQAETAYNRFIKTHGIQAPKIQVNAPAAVPAPTAIPTPQFQKGQRVRQNGIVYEFNGTTWESAR